MTRITHELEHTHPDDLLSASAAPPNTLHQSTHLARRLAEESGELPTHAKPNLRLIDGDTGELLCEDCQRYKAESELKARQLEDAERELRTYRRKVRTLEDARAKEREVSPKRAVVTDIFDYWKLQTGHPNSKLTDDRFDAIEHSLKKYKPEEIKWACAYIGAFPYSGEYGKRLAEGISADRRDGIVMILDKADRFEQWANEGYRLLKKRGEITATTLFG